ncbi:unknown protein (Partial), partial [Seminavis robusta]|eukprot:Sro3797_g351120.1 n/a (440) ;mRNA; r:2-1321
MAAGEQQQQQQQGKGPNNRNNNRQKFTGNCNCCGRKGHKAADCWDHPDNVDKKPKWYVPKKDKTEVNAAATSPKPKKGSRGKNGGGGKGFDILMGVVDLFDLQVQVLDKLSEHLQEFPNSVALLQDPNVWIVDSGASYSMTCHLFGLYDLQPLPESEAPVCANGGTASVTQLGRLDGTICDNQGSPCMDACMTDVGYCEHGQFNLFASNRLLKRGWTEQGNEFRKLFTSPTGVSFAADIIIDTKRGRIYALYFKRHGRSEVLTPAIEADSTGPRMSIAKAHQLFGHSSEDITRKTAKALNIVLTRGTLAPCEACSRAKAKQKNVPKESDLQEQLTLDNDRLHLDQSTLINKETGKVFKHWRLLVYACTGTKITNFYKSKNGMVEPTCEKLYQLQSRGFLPDVLRMDNAGENQTLEKRLKSKHWKIPIAVEYTARNTPQQN